VWQFMISGDPVVPEVLDKPACTVITNILVESFNNFTYSKFIGCSVRVVHHCQVFVIFKLSLWECYRAA
jgi:hypothetical protein